VRQEKLLIVLVVSKGGNPAKKSRSGDETGKPPDIIVRIEMLQDSISTGEATSGWGKNEGLADGKKNQSGGKILTRCGIVS